MRRSVTLPRLVLFISLPLIFVYLLWARPPVPFYALLIVPIALAAVLYEFAGGLLLGLAAVATVALLLALDGDATRRAAALQEAWPILLVYLAVGPVAGWLATRERDRERQIVASARRLHVVQEIAQAITSSLDLQEVLDTIMVETRRLIPFHRAAVLLSEAQSLRVLSATAGQQRRHDLRDRRFAIDDTAAGLAIKSGQIWRGSTESVGRYADTRLLCGAAGACSIVPLHFSGQVTGALIIGGPGLDKLPGSDTAHLNQIAAQIAMAIEHARQYELQRDRSRALRAISDAGREIAASLDLKRTLSLVMSQAAGTLPLDAGALFTFDDTENAFRVAVSHNLSRPREEEIRFAAHQGVPGWVRQHGRVLLVPDAAADERVHPAVVAEGIRSVLAVPLVVRQRFVGVLNLYSKTRTEAFDAEDARLAQVFADQAAVFIDNARLLEELRQAAAELEARVEARTAELRTSQAQAIRAEKMAAVGRLAGSVAHEVNNPLQAIALHLQLITEAGLSPPAQRELAIVQEELARIAGLTQRLLDFERPRSGQPDRQRIVAILDDVLALSGKQLQRAGVRVVRDIPANLPRVLVVGNELKQVFLNLILNAIEAMPEGGQLGITARLEEDAVVVHMTDTGRGIPAAAMAQLFEPFFTTRTRGSGLGLAVSHDIVTRHGGSLTAANRPEGGAVFSVALPRAAERVHA